MIKYLVIWIATGLLIGYIAGRRQGEALGSHIIIGMFLGFLSPVLFWINLTNGVSNDFNTNAVLDECECGYPILPDDRECKVCGRSFRPEGYEGYD